MSRSQDWIVYLIGGAVTLVATLLYFIDVATFSAIPTVHEGISYGWFIALGAAIGLCLAVYLKRANPQPVIDTTSLLARGAREQTASAPTSDYRRTLGQGYLLVLFGLAGALWLLFVAAATSIEGDFAGTDMAVFTTGLGVMVCPWVVAVVAAIVRPRKPALLSAGWMLLFQILNFLWALVGGSLVGIGRLGGATATSLLIFAAGALALAAATLVPATTSFQPLTGITARLPRGSDGAAKLNPDGIPWDALRQCPHCPGSMMRDAAVCPHCRTPSDPWVFHGGYWWSGGAYLHPEQGWLLPPPAQHGPSYAAED